MNVITQVDRYTDCIYVAFDSAIAHDDAQRQEFGLMVKVVGGRSIPVLLLAIPMKGTLTPYALIIQEPSLPETDVQDLASLSWIVVPNGSATERLCAPLLQLWQVDGHRIACSIPARSDCHRPFSHQEQAWRSRPRYRGCQWPEPAVPLVPSAELRFLTYGEFVEARIGDATTSPSEYPLAYARFLRRLHTQLCSAPQNGAGQTVVHNAMPMPPLVLEEITFATDELPPLGGRMDVRLSYLGHMGSIGPVDCAVVTVNTEGKLVRAMLAWFNPSADAPLVAAWTGLERVLKDWGVTQDIRHVDTIFPFATRDEDGTLELPGLNPIVIRPSS